MNDTKPLVHHGETAVAGSKAGSPFIPMFEQFRSELDAHYDTRERIIKASRDITAASKKIIFALQRVKALQKPLDKSIQSTIKPHDDIIKARLESIAPDIQNLNAFRYASNISGGIQELEEAVLFQHYLETQTILSFEEARERLAGLTISSGSAGEGSADGDGSGKQSNRVQLTYEDYVLGLYDMTGELMRFAITNVAVSAGRGGSSNTQSSIVNTTGSDSMDIDQKTKQKRQRTPLDDLREARFRLDLLDFGTSFTHFSKDAHSKAKVTHASVEKVEKAVYGMIVRGSERPAGWVPDTRDERPDPDA